MLKYGIIISLILICEFSFTSNFTILANSRGFDFQITKEDQSMQIEWNSIGEGYKYTVYEKINDYPWLEINSYNNPKGSRFTCEAAYIEDSDSPSIPAISHTDAETGALSFYSADYGSIISYKVDAEKNGDKIHSTEKGISNISGLMGYIYAIDEYDEQNNPVTDISEYDETKFLFPGETLFIGENASPGSYIHIFAVDNTNNISAALHFNIYEALGWEKTQSEKVNIIGEGYVNMEYVENIFSMTVYYDKDMKTEITAPDVPGWELVYDDEQIVEATFGEDREVTFKYRPKLSVATVRGIDVNTGDIIYEDSSPHYEGRAYTAIPPEIHGYEPAAAQSPVDVLVLSELDDNAAVFKYKRESDENSTIFVNRYLSTKNDDIFIESDVLTGQKGSTAIVCAPDVNNNASFLNSLEDIPILVYDYSEIHYDSGIVMETMDSAIYRRFGDVTEVKQFYKAIYSDIKTSNVYICYMLNGIPEAVASGGALAYRTEVNGGIKLKCPGEYKGYGLIEAYEYAETDEDKENSNTFRKRNYQVKYDSENDGTGLLDIKTDRLSHYIFIEYGSISPTSDVEIRCVDEDGRDITQPMKIIRPMGSKMDIDPYTLDFYNLAECYVDGDDYNAADVFTLKKESYEVTLVYSKQINESNINNEF